MNLRRWALFLAFAAFVVLAGATTTIAVENRDSFCASCHLPPEATLVARASTSPARDLAAAHALLEPAVRCIDCHAGATPAHRLRGIPLAARDAAAFLSGNYTVVGEEYSPLGRQASYPAGSACLDCHDDVLTRAEFEQHFHGLLDDPEAPELACSICHRSHALRPAPDSFLTDQDSALGCNDCHAAMGGPSASLGGSAAPGED
jgi:hypothetical protein